ncbi:radical SAM protein [bacterium]|nr:radical SAM protein [bacterium]
MREHSKSTNRVAKSVNDELPVSKTTSICPECNMIIEADIFERDAKIWIRKECPEHGEVEDLYYGSAELYRKAERFAHDGRGIYNPNVNKKDPVCPSDCGLCSRHKTHTVLANLVVTNRCDLSCYYCFFYSKRLGYVYEPTLNQLEEMIKTLRSQEPVACNALQITGGEPLLRDDLIDIIKLCKKYGVDHLQLNTNGIRISQDSEFLKKARALKLNSLYLSFDGVTPKTNPKNHWEIPGVLENCREAGLGAVLVPTVIRGKNDHELGNIIKFGINNIDIVRGINFQPVSLVGKITKADRKEMRITIPDVLEKIQEQTNGQVSMDDFYPVPVIYPFTRFIEALTGTPQYDLSAHFACGMATYVFKDGDNIIPITRFVDVEGLFGYMNKLASDLESGKSKTVVRAKMLFRIRSFIDKKKEPRGLNLWKILFNAFIRHDYKALGEFHYKTLLLGLMHFQDKYNLDLERVKRCCVHNALTDGRIIPFCTFNAIPEWYRDASQESQGVEFSRWEDLTGRSMKDDLYKRDIKKLAASPLYKKAYDMFLS